jgi:curli biogenesis system outer membrane secretion channel CsgG
MRVSSSRILIFLAVLVAISVQNAEAAGLKKIVAVSRFENKTAWKGQVLLDDGMADQLTDALMKGGEFTVLERQTLGDVMAEQDFAASGRTAQSQSAQTGKLLSAQILVKGTITEFENASTGSDSGVGFGGFKIGSKREEAHVGLIVRLIDSTTGEVIASERVEGKATAGGMKFGMDVGGVQFGTAGFAKTPLGKATQIAIDNAVVLISNKLRGVPFQARIIKASGDEVYIGAGAKTGVSDGDTFTVYSVGEDLIDPVTGEKLGSEEEAKGTVRVTKVEDKFCKAKSDAPLTGVKVGDIVRAK